ncbi:hypothetical protein T11_4562 [Trichinella zimbabwensis]|uniref:Uncharacterized protein n=1 Tax=Trichinella zimbabwensis TaxID=268475 RepID=A0A0V1H2E7_9BILA|nr:hypothetical protein T11_4562 [Trichinella zimbabwensis]
MKNGAFVWFCSAQLCLIRSHCPGAFAEFVVACENAINSNLCRRMQHGICVQHMFFQNTLLEEETIDLYMSINTLTLLVGIGLIEALRKTSIQGLFSLIGIS